MAGGGWKVGDGGPVTAVDLGEFVVGAGQADLESFDFAEPSFAFGLGDPSDEVVADLHDSLPLNRIWPVHRAAQAGVLVDARGGVGAAAQSCGDLSALEVPEELLPFLVCGDAIFVAWAQASAPGQEGQVGLDSLLGVDGLVAECDVDVAVSCDDLGDVGWQAVEDGVGDEEP